MSKGALRATRRSGRAMVGTLRFASLRFALPTLQRFHKIGIRSSLADAAAYPGGEMPADLGGAR
jgi:hypothetical protein